MSVGIHHASPADAKELTSTTFAAKRHWNYPEAWIRLWSDELTIDSSYIEANRVFMAREAQRIVGWVAVTTDGERFWLDYCWVLPEAAGRGVGRRLVHEALAAARGMGATAIGVIADPHAAAFYRKLGFVPVGEYPSVPEGRRLPVLQATLQGAIPASSR